MMILNQINAASFTNFILLAFALALTNCSENGTAHDQDKILEFDIKLSANEIFTYDLGGVSIEGGFSIARQAKHFEVSEIQITSDPKHQNIYQPIKGYQGPDYVELQDCQSPGDGSCSQIVSHRFNFVIKE